MVERIDIQVRIELTKMSYKGARRTVVAFAIRRNKVE